MLGLREQIHCDPARIGIAIADDDDLARAGNRVDADAAEDRALGGGDIGVARPDDLVDRRNRRRAIGERKFGKAPVRERVCQYVWIAGGDVDLKKKIEECEMPQKIKTTKKE